MIVKVEVPLSLHLIPPAFVRQVVGGLTQEQIKTNFPNVTSRMVELGQFAADRWVSKIHKIPGATGRPLRINPYVPFGREEYAKSIRLTPLTYEPELAIEVYSDEQQAELIEQGTGEINMHDALATSEKARLSKPRKTPSGIMRQHLYLRIPFRHATQSAEGGPVLPQSVIQAMKPKAKYLVVGRYQEPSVTRPGQQVERFRYSKRPGRLTAEELAELHRKAAAKQGYLVVPGGVPAPQILTQRGLQRLVGLMRTGETKHGGYLTIRTLSEANTKGWRIPAYPAQHLLRQVQQDVEQEISQGFFDEALRADMQVWIANTGA